MKADIPGDWIAAAGAVLAAFLTGAFAWIVRMEERPKKKPIALQSIEADAGRVGVLSSIIDELQEERRQLRHDQNNLQMRFEALDRKMESTVERARKMGDRYERNMRKLRDHIQDCYDLLRGVGVRQPPAPSLESSDE